ncbi:MAG: VPLPA-CTERM sorting domain-containing protein [Pseudooceanicola sp.]
MLRHLTLAAALCLSPFAAHAVTEATPTDPGGFDLVAAPGSSLVANNGIYVGNIFGGAGIAISGKENITVTLTTGQSMNSFAFDIYEPTLSEATLEGCNTTCVDSTFELNFFKSGSLVNSATIMPDDDVITSYAYSGFQFDTLVFTEIVGTNDNEFFANFSAAVVPVPAAGLLLIGALAGLGLARRRG